MTMCYTQLRLIPRERDVGAAYDARVMHVGANAPCRGAYRGFDPDVGRLTCSGGNIADSL